MRLCGRNSDEIAYIRIENVDSHPDGTADYAVHIAVDRAQGAVGLHKRPVMNFPRTKYNVLGLLLQALNTLEPSELELERDTSTSDLARRFGRIRGALPR